MVLRGRGLYVACCGFMFRVYLCSLPLMFVVRVFLGFFFAKVFILPCFVFFYILFLLFLFSYSPSFPYLLFLFFVLVCLPLLFHFYVVILWLWIIDCYASRSEWFVSGLFVVVVCAHLFGFCRSFALLGVLLHHLRHMSGHPVWVCHLNLRASTLPCVGNIGSWS